MICDRSFDVDGSFLYPSLDLTCRANLASKTTDGILGDTILVNGARGRCWEVSATNTGFAFSTPPTPAATSSPWSRETVPLSSRSAVTGAARPPIGHGTIRIAQAERFDVVVDFSKYSVGDEITLKNRMGQARPPA